MILVPPGTGTIRVCLGGITVVSKMNRFGEYSDPTQSSVSPGFSAMAWFIWPPGGGAATPVIATRATTVPLATLSISNP
jgi:hypothetical protein